MPILVARVSFDTLRLKGTQTMKVSIVGGGIGGMALALSLVDAGIDDVDVYESTSAIRL